MRRFCKSIFALIIIFALFSSTAIYADGGGEGNIDNGGGGMGSGTGTNFWNTNDEGVRVTVIRASDQVPVTTPIDFTNRNPSKSLIHFGKYSKIHYRNGTALHPSTASYTYVQPDKKLPSIIKSNRVTPSLEEIKKYFCSEYMAKRIANATNIDYEMLINGSYKLLLEPIAYITFQGTKMAMTAHEAALYDQVLSGSLRSKMVSLTHQNLPLSMFLETPDLGFPAWNDSTNSRVSNDQILSSLGLGIVRFKDAPTTPPPIKTQVEYRTNTDVITSVLLSTSKQINPKSPASVTFSIMGSSLTVTNIVIPEGDSQLVWVKWRTPSTPQTVSIQISSTDGNLSENVIQAAIIDLDQNPPPDPKATDRNSAYKPPTVPAYSAKTSTSWGVWSASWHQYLVWIPDWEWVENSKGKGRWRDRGYWEDQGWWDYRRASYTASLSANQTVTPDSKSPTRSTNQMKSGYGIEMNSITTLSSNAPSSHITGTQHAISYFPEFSYQKYWRLHDVKSAGFNASFWLKPNEYSTYNSRVHFTPIWFPNSSYTPITRIIDAWTPAGMLTLQLQRTITISGNLFSDWHIAPQNPK